MRNLLAPFLAPFILSGVINATIITPHVFKEYDQSKVHLLKERLSFDKVEISNCDGCEEVQIPNYVKEGFVRLIEITPEQMRKNVTIPAQYHRAGFETRSTALDENELGIVVDYHLNYTHVFSYQRNQGKYEIQIEKTYAVSTGKGGLGNKRKSGATSPGVHAVYFLQHMNAQEGEIVYAKPSRLVGKVIEPSQGDQWWGASIITTRRIRLAGLESINTNSVRRSILLHGTNEEGFIGMQKSGGCVRMYNRDVIELADKVRVGTLVNIVGNTEGVDFTRDEVIPANNKPNQTHGSKEKCQNMNYASLEMIEKSIRLNDFSVLEQNNCNAKLDRF